MALNHYLRLFKVSLQLYLFTAQDTLFFNIFIQYSMYKISEFLHLNIIKKIKKFVTKGVNK